MARNPDCRHIWTPGGKDDVSVADARILLALLQCTRELPSAYPANSFDELGALVAPIYEGWRAPLRSIIRSHLNQRGRCLPLGF